MSIWSVTGSLGVTRLVFDLYSGEEPNNTLSNRIKEEFKEFILREVGGSY